MGINNLIGDLLLVNAELQVNFKGRLFVRFEEYAVIGTFCSRTTATSGTVLKLLGH